MPFKKGHKIGLGRTPWNKGKIGVKTSNKGMIAWNKGKELSDEHKKRLSISHKGLQISPDTQFKKGYLPWNKNKQWLSNRGKNHWHWKGGVYKRYLHSTQLVEYKLWRKSVFERDNYTCQHCGNKNLYLEAHHIKSWAEYEDLRFVISNGLTLCKGCHKKETYKSQTD
jgi:hypothetical protein